MGIRRLVELRQPEGGLEHELVYSTHHRCPQGNALQRDMGPECDALVYPVGNYGFAMPLNVPFSVLPIEPCAACGANPACGFVWRRGHTSYAGRLWTPGGEQVEL